MSTNQTSISIPVWYTYGSGWTVSSQGNCRVTVTRNYGDNYATVSTYWGYCSPGGTQATVTCDISVVGTSTVAKSWQLFGATIHNPGVWYYANGSSFTVPVSDSASNVTVYINMTIGAGTSGQTSSTPSKTVSYDSRGETIPVLSKSTADMGTAITLTMTPYVSTFAHKVYYSVDGGKTKTLIANKGAGTSTQSFTIPTSLATTIPNETSMALSIICETYTDANYTSRVGGDKSSILTATIPSSYVPSISSVTITEATAKLASQFGVFVQSKSTLKIVTASSGSNGSTIKSTLVQVDKLTYSGSTVTTAIINSSGTLNINVVVTDSRGRTASTTKQVTVYAYTPPQIKKVEVTRSTSTGKAQDDGTYALFTYDYSIADVNGKNTHALNIQHKKSDGSWETLTSLQSYVASGTYNSSTQYDINNKHVFRFQIVDFFSTYEVEMYIDISFALINFGANGRNIHIRKHPSQTDGYLQVDIPLKNASGNTAVFKNRDDAKGLIDAMDSGSATPMDADYYISQWVNGGTSNTMPVKRPISSLWAYMKSKIETAFFTYSTTEKAVGKWIDGKIIYQRTFTGKVNGDFATISNFNEFIHSEGHVLSIYGHYWDIPTTYHVSSGYTCSVFVYTDGRVRVEGGDYVNGQSCSVTIWYTKK